MISTGRHLHIIYPLNSFVEALNRNTDLSIVREFNALYQFSKQKISCFPQEVELFKSCDSLSIRIPQLGTVLEQIIDDKVIM